MWVVMFEQIHLEHWKRFRRTRGNIPEFVFIDTCKICLFVVLKSLFFGASTIQTFSILAPTHFVV